MTYIHKKVELCSRWDNCPVYATVQEDDGQGYVVSKEEEGMGRMDAV